MADSLANLQSLMQMFTGKSSTQKSSGITTTTKSSLTEADISKLVQSALESNGGLASVAAGQAGAGMYNSTVNTQLTNDLLSRIATQFASSNASKTTTTSGGTVTTKAPGMGGTGLLGLLGASFAKNQIDPYLTGKKKIADLITGLGNSEAATAGVNVDSIAPMIEQSNTAPVEMSSLLTDSLDMLQEVDLSGLSDLVDFSIDAFVDSIGTGIGTDLDFSSLEWDW